MERIINEQALRGFAGFLAREEREKSTQEAYMRHVRSFSAWLSGRPVDKELTIEWKAAQQRRYAPATVNAMIAAVNAFFQWMDWADCRVRSLRLQRRSFRGAERELTRREYEALVRAAQDMGKHRLALLMETICATGIRVSEVRYITVEAARSGRAEVALKGKIRTILLPGKLCRKLLKYAEKQKTASGEIFLTKSGRSLARGQIWAEMKGLCTAAGVCPEKVFPHNLRHLFATAFYRVCGDIVKLADVLGHSSMETTRLYLLTTGKEHAKTLEKLGLIT